MKTIRTTACLKRWEKISLRCSCLGLLAGLLTGAGATQAQTVYAGESSIDNARRPGLYLTIPGDGRQIEKDWEAQLRTFGRVTASRGTYRVTSADIADVSPDPVNLVSTVKSSRNSVTIFTSFDTGSGHYVTAGSAGYSAAEKLLNDFASNMRYAQAVRTAEQGVEDAQKNHLKSVRNGERLQREIEQNGKEKERLLKRIDENAKALEQLQKDLEANKTEQENALTELDNRKKTVDTIKAQNNP